MAAVIDAFQQGELQTVMRTGVYPICIRKAFTEERVKEFARQYKDNQVVYD